MSGCAAAKLAGAGGWWLWRLRLCRRDSVRIVGARHPRSAPHTHHRTRHPSIHKRAVLKAAPGDADALACKAVAHLQQQEYGAADRVLQHKALQGGMAFERVRGVRLGILVCMCVCSGRAWEWECVWVQQPCAGALDRPARVPRVCLASASCLPRVCLASASCLPGVCLRTHSRRWLSLPRVCCPARPTAATGWGGLKR